MPIPARLLVENQSTVHRVLLTDLASKADDLMKEHDIKQVPVVNLDDRPFGLITSERIASFKADFKDDFHTLTADDIVVPHVATFSADHEIFSLLDGLGDFTAVLLTDTEGKLEKIITKRDTLSFLRRRAEPILLIERIELALKRHIQQAYPNASDLQVKVNEISGKRNKTEIHLNFIKEAVIAVFKIKRYELTLEDQEMHDTLESTFSLKEVKAFDDLTLDSYIKIITINWELFAPSFKRTKKIWTNLLESVRDIRNKVCHFKGNVSRDELLKLRHCLEWIDNISWNTPA